jgi:O-antigen/teichoic acid export membrane protein
MMASVIAKLGTPAKLGEYVLAIVVSGPIIMFSYMGLQNYMVTDATRQFPFRNYLFLRLLTSTAAVLLVTAFSFKMYDPATACVIVFVAAVGGLDSLSDIIYGLLKLYDRSDCVARSMAIKGCTNLLFVWLGMFLTRNVVWAAFGSMASSLVIVVFYDIPTGYLLFKEHNKDGHRLSIDLLKSTVTLESMQIIKKIAVVTMPLAVISLLIAAIGNVPQYFIQGHLGPRDLGLYSAGTYLINVGRVGVLAVGMAATPFLAREYAARARIPFRNMAIKLLLIACVLAFASPLAAMVIGKKAVTILFSAEYAQNIKLIVMILVAGGLRYVTSIMGYIITSARAFYIQIYWFAATLVVAIASSWWFIPRLGLQGAALSAVLTAGTEIILGFCVLIRIMLAQKKDINAHIINDSPADLRTTI